MVGVDVAGNGRQAAALLESGMRLDPPWSPLRGGMVGVEVAGNGRQAAALLESKRRLDPPWSPLRGGKG
jgi:hypothetical protein